MLVPGNLVARYFERVLGVRWIGSAMAESMRASLPMNSDLGGAPRICLLLEVGYDSETPSLQEMGSRLLEALRKEWLKHSLDQLPEVKWLRVQEESWPEAICDFEPRLALAIVCGSRQSPAPDSLVVHVPSFVEMHSSHVLKREAWHTMQSKIASTANMLANSAIHHAT